MCDKVLRSWVVLIEETVENILSEVCEAEEGLRGGMCGWGGHLPVSC